MASKLVKSEAVVFAGVHAHAVLVAIPFLPGIIAESLIHRTAMDCLIGKLYFLAKPKSRSSCAGTAITAPSP